MNGIPPPNDPIKGTIYRYGAVVAAALLIAGVILGQWVFIVLGAIGVFSGLAGLSQVRQERNPWWTRSPLDYWQRRRKS